MSFRLGLLSGLVVAWVAGCAAAQEGEVWRVLEGHESWVYSVAFSPDSKTLASASADGTVRLWRLPDGKPKATLRLGKEVHVGLVEFFPNGRSVVVSSYQEKPGPGKGVLSWWDLEKGRQVRQLAFPGGVEMALSPDGKWLANSTGERGVPVIEVREGATGKKVYEFKTINDFRFLAFSPDSRLLAVSEKDDRQVMLWDVAKRKRHVTIPTPRFNSVAFSSDWTEMAGTDPGLTLIDVEGKKVRKFIRDISPPLGSGCLIYSPDDKVLVCVAHDRSTLQMVERATGKRLRLSLNGLSRSGWLNKLRVSADGKHLAAAGDKGVTLWCLDRLREMATWRD